MSVAVDRLLESLERHDCRPRRRASGWSALCPAHDDRVSSLSVSEGCEGRALAYCHAGCGAEGIAAALGLTVADLFERDDAAPAKRSPVKTPAPLPSDEELRGWRGRLLASPHALARVEELRGWRRETLEALGVGYDGERLVHPVQGADGALVSVLRYRPGARPEDERKLLAPSGRARELHPAPETCNGTVWLLEGEPDAISARELGLPGVGVPGTAGWRDSWAKRFAHKRVVVLFDCDEPGRNAAKRVAKSLAGHAADVRVVDLDPGRDDGYDLSDWLLEAADCRNGREDAKRVLLRMADYAGNCAHSTTVEPPATVEPGALLDRLVEFARRFVAMSPAQATVVALWTVHAHAIEAAETTPYLAVTSAEKRSGKSRLLEVLALVVARPLSTANVSDAALFRSIGESHPPTLLFDEVDATFGPKARDREDLRALLNAGYRRGATVLRCVGDGSKQKVESYPVFGAKVLAGIGKLPDTIADRSVPVRLERRAPGEHVERFRRREVEPEADELREHVAQFAAAHAEALRDARPDLPEVLDDRAQDVAEPLLAIADVAGGEWPERARRALAELYGGREVDDESGGVRLLSDIRHVFDEHGVDRLSSADLLAALHAFDEAPWSDWYGKPLTTRGLSRLLKPYGIKGRNVRLEPGDDRVAKGFHSEQFEAAWSRYVP